MIVHLSSEKLGTHCIHSEEYMPLYNILRQEWERDLPRRVGFFGIYFWNTVSF